MRLLVIDDDADHREALAAALEDEGHVVATAPEAASALAWLDASSPDTRPDVIILDWMMPCMDAVEFRRRQRADHRLAPIPVVLMTAASGARVPLAEIEPDAALYKPTALATLLAVLERLAGKGPTAKDVSR